MRGGTPFTPTPQPGRRKANQIRSDYLQRTTTFCLSSERLENSDRNFSRAGQGGWQLVEMEPPELRQYPRLAQLRFSGEMFNQINGGNPMVIPLNVDLIHNAQKPLRLNDDLEFFVNFSSNSRRNGLKPIDLAARQSPVASFRWPTAFHKQELTFTENRCSATNPREKNVITHRDHSSS